MTTTRRVYIVWNQTHLACKLNLYSLRFKAADCFHHAVFDGFHPVAAGERTPYPHPMRLQERDPNGAP